MTYLFEVRDPAGFELGEHPVWDAGSGRVGWVDVPTGDLRWLGRGLIETWSLPAPLGAVALRQRGGVVAAAGTGFEFRDASGNPDRDRIDGLLPSGVRYNDGACDPQGRFVIGTATVDGRRGGGALYRLDPAGAVTVLLEGVTESNGLCWSLDGAIFYYVDSGDPVIRRYAYSADGLLSRLPDFYVAADGDGVPDGLCIDAEGALWVAMWQGGTLRRLAPDGSELDVIPVPVSQPTCPAFVGRKLDRLVLATAWESLATDQRAEQPWAGHLLGTIPGVRGVAAHAFAG